MKFDFEKEVPFDPGFSPMVVHFSSNMEAVLGVIKQLKSPHQKKFKFKMLYPQIFKLFENIVSFYSGCLLWASYIKNEHPNKFISGNAFYKQNTEDYDFMYEVEYIIKSFEKFEKDCKYYLNTTSKIPQEWQKITEVYKKFLGINNNFFDTQKTEEILLPDELKNFSKEEQEQNFEVIKKSIEEKNLSLLTKIEIFI